MDLAEGIKSRRAIRKFKKKPVPKELLEEVFELAKWSPVPPLFRQWKYTVVMNKKKRDNLVNFISKNTTHLRDLLQMMDEESKRKAEDFYPDLGEAPVILIISVPLVENQWDRRFLLLATATEIQNLFLAAYQKGLGACGVCMSPWVEDHIKEKLGLEDQEILCGVALGYPDEEPAPGPHERVKTTYIE